MPNNMEKPSSSRIYDAELRIISPVVIQTGEKYGFMELIPSSKQRTGKILDAVRTISTLDEKTKEKLLNYCSTGDSKSIFGLFKRDGITKGSNVIFTDSVYDKISQGENLEINKPIVNPMTKKPFIPGSSIKGALRTAFLESRRGDMEPGDEKKIKEFEYKILENNGGILKDPFKNIFVSDFFIQNSNLIIGDISIGRIPVYSGMTDAWCLRNEDISFDGKDKNQKDVIAKGTITIKKPKEELDISMKMILDSLSFYDNKFLIKQAWKNEEGAQKLWDRCSKEKRSQEEYFIRIGRFIGIENVTLDVARSIKGYTDTKNITGGKSKPMLMGHYPLGFCLLTVKERTL